METKWQVFVELNTQARLNNGEELRRAEVFLFKDILSKRRFAAINVPDYCITDPFIREPQARGSLAIKLKVLGGWVRLWLSFVGPDAVVICDRAI